MTATNSTANQRRFPVDMERIIPCQLDDRDQTVRFFDLDSDAEFTVSALPYLTSYTDLTEDTRRRFLDAIEMSFIVRRSLLGNVNLDEDLHGMVDRGRLSAFSNTGQYPEHCEDLMRLARGFIRYYEKEGFDRDKIDLWSSVMIHAAGEL